MKSCRKVLSHPCLLHFNDKIIRQSHELYRILLQPLEKELACKQHLIIIPERDLWLLPFEILLKSDEKRPYAELDYLLKEYKTRPKKSSLAQRNRDGNKFDGRTAKKLIYICTMPLTA